MSVSFPGSFLTLLFQAVVQDNFTPFKQGKENAPISGASRVNSKYTPLIMFRWVLMLQHSHSKFCLASTSHKLGVESTATITASTVQSWMSTFPHYNAADRKKKFSILLKGKFSVGHTQGRKSEAKPLSSTSLPLPSQCFRLETFYLKSNTSPELTTAPNHYLMSMREWHNHTLYTNCCVVVGHAVTKVDGTGKGLPEMLYKGRIVSMRPQSFAVAAMR